MEKQLQSYLESRHKPQNTNAKHKENLNFQDKIALSLTSAIGTMYAVYFFICFMVGWMIWQTSILAKPFDPYPFAFLLFLGNIIQLILMPLIMVGQNLQGKHAQIRADEEYNTTNSSYKDIEQIILHLNKQDEQMKKQLELLLDLEKKIK